MKYKDCSELCSYGCGRKRRPGQRVCKECHAREMRENRAKANGMDAKQTIERALVKVTKKRIGRGMTPEMRERLASMAAEFARKMDEFDGVQREAAA